MQNATKVVLGASILANALLMFVKKKPSGGPQPVFGYAGIKTRELTPGSFDVTVTGTCSSSEPPELEFFDLSYYVNDQLGAGTNWATPDVATQWTEGLPPAVGEEKSKTFRWYPTAPGTYALKARLYIRNAQKLEVEVWSQEVTVTVGEGLTAPTGSAGIAVAAI